MSSFPRPYPPFITFTFANANDGLTCQARSPSTLRQTSEDAPRSHLSWPTFSLSSDVVGYTQMTSSSSSTEHASTIVYDTPPSPQNSPPSPSYSTSWVPTQHSPHAAEDCPPSPTFSPLSPIYTALSPRFHPLEPPQSTRPNSSQAHSDKCDSKHPPTTPPHSTSTYLPTPPETPEEAQVKAAANEANEAANTLLTLLHTPVSTSKTTASVSHIDQARSILGLNKPSLPTINLSHQPMQLEHTQRPILSSSHSSSLPHRHRQANTSHSTHTHLTFHPKAKPKHQTPSPSRTLALSAAQSLSSRLIRPALRASTPLSSPLWFPTPRYQKTVVLRIKPVTLQRVTEGRIMKVSAGVSSSKVKDLVGRAVVEEAKGADGEIEMGDRMLVMDVVVEERKKA